MAEQAKPALTGGDVNYYLIEVPDPKRLQPYTAEVEDLIEALDMEFAEGTILKSLVRLCKNRQGGGKIGSTDIYEAEKIVYSANRVLAKAKRRMARQEQAAQRAAQAQRR